MAFLEKTVHLLNRYLSWIAGIFLVAMMLLTCSNIFLRIIWLPVKGTFELMGFFGAIATAFALGYTQIHRGHVAVDILFSAYSRRARKFLNVLNSAICMVFFSFVAWQIAKWSTILKNTGELTETLRISYYPFTYGVALGFAILSFVFLSDLLRYLLPEKEDKK